MHLEPEITRFCSVQRCGLLIGICAASFSRGGNPSYARHSTFSILIAGNHSGIKIQNATDKVNPAQLAQCDDQSQVSLSSLRWSWSEFVWSGPTFLRYHGPGLGEPNPPRSLMKYVSWARWQTERIRFFVRRREFKIHNLNGCCKMGRKHGYSGPAPPYRPRCRDSFVQ